MINKETATTRTYACDYCGEKGIPIRTIGCKEATPGWVYVHALRQHVACACPNEECQQRLDKQFPKKRYPIEKDDPKAVL